MPKTEKKNGKSPKKTEKAAEEGASKGRLVSLDGTSGAALISESERLARLCCGEGDPAWSRWDASNTFWEMRMGKAKHLNPTPHTLVLLYASDLLFRLRWEIGPAVQEGRTVVAAPYVESAVGFGLAAGLSKEWLDELFTFAAKPDFCFRLKEKKKDKGKAKGAKKAKKKAAKNGGKAPAAVIDGFVEFCAMSLAKNHPDWDAAEARKARRRKEEPLYRVHVSYGSQLEPWTTGVEFGEK
jgi:thymidylate kinase